MPNSREAKYYHIRLKNPRAFVQKSFRTVPVTHTDYKGKHRRAGVLAIVGYNYYSNRWETQGLRVPKIG